jgi:branched-chain amino acid transport system substrate-binding protein
MALKTLMRVLALGTALAATPALADEIAIAVVGPMTGQLAAIGDQFRNGAQAAVDAINAAGGVNGNTLKLVVEDDQCDPKQAVSVANRLVGQGVMFVDGHACSGASIPASQVYAENNMLMMSPASSNPALTDEAAAKGWSTIMRLYTRDDAQGEFLGPWLAEQYKDKKVAVLHDKTPYGQGLATAVKDSFEAAGGKAVLFEGINPGEKDYNSILIKLKDLGADLVYFGGYHPEAGLMLRQSADLGFKLNLMMGDSIASPEFWAVSGPAGEGTMFTFPADPQARPEAKEAVEKFKAAGFVPEGFTLFSYATVQAIAEGIKRSGSTNDGAAVAAALKNGEPVQTIIGPVTFDEKGDIVGAEYDINVWSDGKYAKMQ